MATRPLSSTRPIAVSLIAPRSATPSPFRNGAHDFPVPETRPSSRLATANRNGEACPSIDLDAYHRDVGDTTGFLGICGIHDSSSTNSNSSQNAEFTAVRDVRHVGNSGIRGHRRFERTPAIERARMFGAMRSCTAMCAIDRARRRQSPCSGRGLRSRAGRDAQFGERFAGRRRPAAVRRRAMLATTSACAAPTAATGRSRLAEPKIALASPISSTTAARPIMPTLTRCIVWSGSLDRLSSCRASMYRDRRRRCRCSSHAAIRPDPFAAQPVGIVERREIAEAGVAQDRRDALARPQLLAPARTAPATLIPDDRPRHSPSSSSSRRDPVDAPPRPKCGTACRSARLRDWR